MAKLSKTEQTTLADSFLHLAQMVGNYRLKHYREMSPLMRSRIRAYHSALIDYADFFYASSTNVLIENAQPFLSELADSIAAFKKIVSRTRKTQKVVDLIGAVTRLGASVISKQPFAIMASMNEFMHKIKSLKKTT